MRASIQCCLRNNPCASVTAAAPMHHLHPRSNLWQMACWHQRRMHSRPLTNTLKKHAAFIRADKCKSLHLLSMACVNKKSTTAKKASFSSIKEGTSMDQQQQKLRPHSITFLTDVEGDGDYFDRFVHNSEILGFRMRNPSYGQYGPFHAISDDSSYDNHGAGGIRNNEGGMEMDQRMNNCKWNLGEWDEDYFPYDKEVIFLDDDGGDDDSRNNSSNDGTCSMLVYGGDIWDKGGADLYVLRQLLSLHRRYPHRVHFLMGNRDINKMRIVDELGVWNENCNSDINLNMCNSTDGNISLPYHGGVYWLRGTGLIGDPLKQDDVVVTNSTSTRNNENKYDNQRRLWHTTATCETNAVPSETAAERLKWMLRKTMGSVDAFELRRSELERERLAIMNASSAFSSCSSMEMGRKEGPGTLQIDVENKMRLCVSDEEVARSYILSCDPVSGIMSQYLSRAKLMIRFGPALFLHGALPFTKSNNLARTSNDTSESLLDSEMKFDYPTPWAAQSASKSEQSLTEWIGESNSFAESQVKAWKDYATSIRAQNSIQQHSQGGIWATEGGYFNSTPGGKMFGALLQFGMGTLPNRSKNPSVVYNSWMRGGMPRNDLFGGKALERLMKKEGLQTIVSGHQPVGDMPWPIQVSFGRGFKESINRWVLPCDTSFSGDTNWALVEGSMSEKRENLGRGLGQSGRGKVSCCETMVNICKTTNNVGSIKMHGYLSDGSYYKTGDLMCSDHEDSILLGRAFGSEEAEFLDTNSGSAKRGCFWVKAKIGQHYLVSHGKGFEVWNSFLNMAERK